MTFEPIFQLGVGNAWVLCIPFVLGGVYITCQTKEIAKRMADMTGYHKIEKLFTILASLAPYPFIIATIWVPFTKIRTFFYIGLVVYFIGLVMFFLALRIIVKTPLDKPFLDGPYRISRNPFYVSAILIFLGICFATTNLILLGYWMFLSILQHVMILAEERICKQRYGISYEKYMQKIPRYLFVF
ncbi:MAG: methyltransferase [Candidatus Omnitrophica bacterium]|jgi:protein-S-isoprenylcysteine O-methyltransferase Ste14|nr:methyltransferase [Candidatus Omnitrophota bacterium]